MVVPTRRWLHYFECPVRRAPGDEVGMGGRWFLRHSTPCVSALCLCGQLHASVRSCDQATGAYTPPLPVNRYVIVIARTTGVQGGLADVLSVSVLPLAGSPDEVASLLGTYFDDNGEEWDVAADWDALTGAFRDGRAYEFAGNRIEIFVRY